MRTKLPKAALNDRYGKSERAAAAIASCVLQDVGMINEKDMSLVIDKNQIRREKHKIQCSLKSDSPNVELHRLYFDERKRNTYH